MHVTITGASGYAGFHAALALSAAGHHVVGIVRRADEPRLAELSRHEVALIEGDVSEPASISDALLSADVVIHTMMGRSDPEGTDRALFAALRDLPERPGARRRLIYTTGCSVYGRVPEHIMDEATAGNPRHALAFRIGLEREALALPGIGVAVVRPGFMYGSDGRSSMAGQWFAAARAGEVVLRGNRGKGWSWVHVADLAQAYRLIAEAGRSVDGEVFCLADERRPTCLEVMTACAREAGYAGEIAFGEPAEDDLASTWFDQDEFITSAKAERLLGWRARHTGVLDLVGPAHRAWAASQAQGVGE